MVYPDGSDIIARRLKCVAWRATVEMSKTVSQLIFLVRSTKDYFISMHLKANLFILYFIYVFYFVLQLASYNKTRVMEHYQEINGFLIEDLYIILKILAIYMYIIFFLFRSKN